jgi:hypothetical protein
VTDRYEGDPISDFRRRRGPAPRERVSVERDLVLELEGADFVGAVVAFNSGLVHLEDRHGRVRVFRFDTPFLLDGRPVLLSPPVAAPAERARTASGSFAVEQSRARVALGSRLLVEGRHDAELVERVWGDDLRVEGVVVELLDGIDHLLQTIEAFDPTRDRRLGVLVDHLVPGSKESRIAESVARSRWAPHVLVVGHPYVDVWQAVRPGRVGLPQWPVIPREIEWKRGVLAALGRPAQTQADVAAGWRAILSTVRGFGDLEPEFLGRVEELIDFVTDPGAAG